VRESHDQLANAEKIRENALFELRHATQFVQFAQRATPRTFHGCALLCTTAFEHAVGAKRESLELRPQRGFDRTLSKPF